MNVNFYQYDKYIIYILYTIYYNTYFVMVPGTLYISVSILSDTESSVCIRCLIPLQRYLISLMLSSRTKQRRQSECKKTTSSTYSKHPFQGRKTDVEKKIEIKGNTKFWWIRRRYFYQILHPNLVKNNSGQQKKD